MRFTLNLCLRPFSKYTAFAAVVLVAAVGIGHAAVTLTTIGTFNGTNGSQPLGGVFLGSDGTVYGTTSTGSLNAPAQAGTVYKIPPGGAVVTVAMFDAPTTGVAPSGGLVADAAGNLYGATTYGPGTSGTTGSGTIFKLTPAGVLTTFATFARASNGARPNSRLVIDRNGNLYGTAEAGGANENGTVFKVTPDGAISTLFTFNRGNGSSPRAGLSADASGNLYGTTYDGGASPGGTVFRVTAAGAFKTLFDGFAGYNGANVYGGVVADADGNLYGTTYFGGSFNNAGTVFKLSKEGVLTSIAARASAGDATAPADPRGSLLLDADGNVFGTSFNGGSSNLGTIFEWARGSSSLTTLFSFDGTNGSHPTGDLVADAGGTLYGTTSGGTVFKFNGSGFVVPEPTALAGIVAASLLRRRRRRRADATRIVKGRDSPCTP